MFILGVLDCIKEYLQRFESRNCVFCLYLLQLYIEHYIEYLGYPLLCTIGCKILCSLIRSIQSEPKCCYYCGDAFESRVLKECGAFNVRRLRRMWCSWDPPTQGSFLLNLTFFTTSFLHIAKKPAVKKKLNFGTTHLAWTIVRKSMISIQNYLSKSHTQQEWLNYLG